MSSRAQRGDLIIMRLLRHYVSRNDRYHVIASAAWRSGKLSLNVAFYFIQENSGHLSHCLEKIVGSISEFHKDVVVFFIARSVALKPRGLQISDNIRIFSIGCVRGDHMKIGKSVFLETQRCPLRVERAGDDV